MHRKIWGSLVLVLTILTSTPLVANAADTVPEGINLESVFDASFTTFEDQQKNAAHVPAGSPNMVEITNDKSQVGAIWSNEQHKFKLHEEKHVSMWIYFGKKTNYAGDGIAFVLHNDSNKTRAIAKDVRNNNGQSLGVWGKNSANSSQEVAKNAIQNSWALEFDTYRNDTLSDGSGLDLKVPKGQSHVYAGFPGKPETYLPIPKKSKTYYLANNEHAKPISNLVDGQWHHLSLDWYPPVANSNQGTMHYKFNDKIYRGADSAAGNIAEDTVKINLDETFGSDVQEVYWGFTGSTGNNAEIARVVFESVPDLVNLKSTQQVVNLTTQQVLASTADGSIPASNHVNVNDKLEYTFASEHEGGQAWKNVHLTLPPIDNLVVSKVEVYQYPKDTQNVVPKKSWHSWPSNQTIISELVKTGEHLEVKVTGEVKKPTATNAQVKVVQKQPVIFNAPNGQIKFEVPPTALIDNKRYAYGFWPNKKNHAINRIDENDDITVKTTITYAGSVDTRAFNQIVMVGEDDREICRFKNADKKGASPAELYFLMGDDHDNVNSKSLEFTIPYQDYHEKLANLFRVGKHPLAFYVADKNNRQVSNYIYLDLTIQGQLKLVVSPQMVFESITLTGQDRELAPQEKSGWYLKILNHGKQDWNLQADVEQLKPQGNSSAKESVGELYFQGVAGEPIASSNNTKMNKNLEHDIGSQLKGKLRLKIFGSAPAGEYSAKIIWTLKSTPA
ncbi:lectin-like domain-containing protein [Lactiplantibacillus fabifermentans]|uniref:lectin-like domain-containing protein n=1 Tax=Lactiplantibacillus fabifermentans TaxID=483011 RepID=UPI0004B838BC|nr:hypothetical protein [Lactiplantibacillus fabifermentans]